METLNVDEWVREHRESFLPPVCNKLMHDGQLKVMLVGGPNERSDFHVEEGEEFFYMLKGDMRLVIVVDGRRKEILIREGESFLLPSRVPHSPQRAAKSLGLVIERRREAGELDALQYYCTPACESLLWQRWFACKSLGTQLAPLMQEFADSEESKTRIPSMQLPSPPYGLRANVRNAASTCLVDRVASAPAGVFPLFEGREMRVWALSQHKDETIVLELPAAPSGVETWLWQWKGSSTVIVDSAEVSLSEGESVLVSGGTVALVPRVSAATLAFRQHRIVLGNGSP